MNHKKYEAPTVPEGAFDRINFSRSIENHCTSVDVCGIYAETTVATGTSIIASDLFSADLEQLSKLYSDASPELKARLAALMDKFYLLVNSDAKNSDLNRLETTLDQLNNLFLTKVQQKHSAMTQSLGIVL